MPIVFHSFRTRRTDATGEHAKEQKHGENDHILADSSSKRGQRWSKKELSSWFVQENFS